MRNTFKPFIVALSIVLIPGISVNAEEQINKIK